MDEKFRNLDCDLIEVDEVWGFIGMKQKTANYQAAPMDMGDVWTWIALDAIRLRSMQPSFRQTAAFPRERRAPDPARQILGR